MLPMLAPWLGSCDLSLERTVFFNPQSYVKATKTSRLSKSLKQEEAPGFTAFISTASGAELTLGSASSRPESVRGGAGRGGGRRCSSEAGVIHLPDLKMWIKHMSSVPSSWQ